MFFIHAYVQAICQIDPEVYATCHDPKIYPHTKFRIPTSNYIQISSELDLARTETRGQGQWPGNIWWLSRVQDVSTYQIWNATMNKIGDLLWVHFFKNWLLRSRSQWMKTVSDIPWQQHISINWIWGLIWHIIWDMLLQGSHRPGKICLGPGKKCLLSWNCPGIL